MLAQSHISFGYGQFYQEQKSENFYGDVILHKVVTSSEQKNKQKHIIWLKIFARQYFREFLAYLVYHETSSPYVHYYRILGFTWVEEFTAIAE